MDFPWKNNRRFNAFTNFYIQRFGERVQKLSINAGFSCPNRDGTISMNGCTYCNNAAFNPSYCSNEKSITQQIAEGIEFHTVRYRRAEKYLAYFQTYSNTYGDIEELKRKYNEAMFHPAVVGIVIGTRPDCLDDDKLQLLHEISQTHFVSVELGVESCYNNTLQKINRGHTFEQSAEAIRKLAARNIHTGIHLIFGLPGESRDEMLHEASIISELPVSSIKFHQLQIIKDTAMAEEFLHNPELFQLFTLNDYIDFIIDFCELLSPDIAIERFTAEVPPRFLVTGSFGNLRTDQLLQKIEKRTEERNTWQGRKFGFQSMNLEP